MTDGRTKDGKKALGQPNSLLRGAARAGGRAATTISRAALSPRVAYFTVLGAVLLGTTVPFLLDAMGVDPTSGASPALATLTDIAGIFVLCGLSSLLLH